MDKKLAEILFELSIETKKAEREANRSLIISICSLVIALIVLFL